MLVQLTKFLIVNTSKIKVATRCGNYTEVRFTDERLEQIWDEDEVVWDRIVAATKLEEQERLKGIVV